MFRAVLTAAGALMLAGCSVVGIRSGYEEPDYSVVERLDDEVEIRRYADRLAAETSVEAADDGAGQNQAFRILFDYIAGANRSRSEVDMTTPVEVGSTAEEIAMTVPVETAALSGGPTTMRFFLPSGYTLANAPEPTDERVRIVERPGATEAVLRFSGLGGDAAIENNTGRLRDVLDGAEWAAVGEPMTLFYDPPWTLPWFRRNEIAILVEGGRAAGQD